MYHVFHIKQLDTAPSLRATLKTPTGAAVNLVGATVRFNMKSESGKVMVDNKTALIIDAANGVVQYDWEEGETGLSGICQAEFEVTYSNNTIETFPNDENIYVKVSPQVA